MPKSPTRKATRRTEDQYIDGAIEFRNQQVAGSIPAGGSRFFNHFQIGASPSGVQFAGDSDAL
jgi:hypothetical protein